MSELMNDLKTSYFFGMRTYDIEFVSIEEFCRTELDTDMRWDIDEIVNMLEQINENTDMCNIVFVDEVTSVTKVDSSGNILLDLNPLSKLSTLARVHAVIC